MYASNVLHAAPCSDVSAILRVVVCVQAPAFGGGLGGGGSMGMAPGVGSSGAQQVR